MAQGGGHLTEECHPRVGGKRVTGGQAVFRCYWERKLWIDSERPILDLTKTRRAFCLALKSFGAKTLQPMEITQKRVEWTS